MRGQKTNVYRLYVAYPSMHRRGYSRHSDYGCDDDEAVCVADRNRSRHRHCSRSPIRCGWCGGGGGDCGGGLVEVFPTKLLLMMMMMLSLPLYFHFFDHPNSWHPGLLALVLCTGGWDGCTESGPGTVTGGRGAQGRWGCLQQGNVCRKDRGEDDEVVEHVTNNQKKRKRQWRCCCCCCCCGRLEWMMLLDQPLSSSSEAVFVCCTCGSLMMMTIEEDWLQQCTQDVYVQFLSQQHRKRLASYRRPCLIE